MSEKCLDYALHYIYRYPKTEKELKIQLMKKWYNDEEIDFAISNLKLKWYVDDKKFAEAYINSELIKKWKPVVMVKSKLLLKWVDKHIIEEVLSSQEEDIDTALWEAIKKEIEKYKRKWLEWFDIIQKLLWKWYKMNDIKKVI